jgi:hypothetical protein
MEIEIQLLSSRETSIKTSDEQDGSIHTLACYSRSHILRPTKNYATHFSTSACMLYALPIIQHFIKSARFQYHHTRWHKCFAIPSRPTWLRESWYLTPSWADVRPYVAGGGGGRSHATSCNTDAPVNSISSPPVTIPEFSPLDRCFTTHSHVIGFRKSLPHLLSLFFMLHFTLGPVFGGVSPSGPVLTHFLKDEAKCLET